MRRLIVFFCLIMALAMLPSVDGGVHRGTLTVDSIQARSGLVEHRNATFDVAWTASIGTDAIPETEYSIGFTQVNLHAGLYIVSRMFFTFDTSDLRNNYRMESANLQVYVTSIGLTPSWTAKIQKWTDTDDSLTVVDFTAFDELYYDDSSMQREDFDVGEWNNIPISDDNLLVKKGETKLCLRISKEIEGYEPSQQVGLGIASGYVKLEINYAWATGSQAKPKTINYIPFVLGVVAICGCISLVALKKGNKKRLYH